MDEARYVRFGIQTDCSMSANKFTVY